MQTSVYLVVDDPHLATSVREILKGQPLIAHAQAPEAVARAIAARHVRLLVTDNLEAAWEVRTKCPECRTILLLTSRNPMHMRSALRAGMDEAFVVPDELHSLPTAVTGLQSMIANERTRESMTVAILSGSGGLGRTTFACGLGRSYARMNVQTLLVDMNLGLGGAESLLGVTPATTLADLVPVMAELDTDQLTSAATQVQDYLDFLAAPTGPLTTADLTADFLPQLLTVAKKAYQVTILDMPTTLAPALLSGLGVIDLLLYLVTADPLASRNLSIMLMQLEQSGIKRDRISIVHRLRGPGSLEIAGQELARQFGLTFLGAVPYDRALAQRSEPLPKEKQFRPGRVDDEARRIAVRLAILGGLPAQPAQDGRGTEAVRSRSLLSWLKGGFASGHR